MLNIFCANDLVSMPRIPNDYCCKCQQPFLTFYDGSCENALPVVWRWDDLGGFGGQGF